MYLVARSVKQREEKTGRDKACIISCPSTGRSPHRFSPRDWTQANKPPTVSAQDFLILMQVPWSMHYLQYGWTYPRMVVNPCIADRRSPTNSSRRAPDFCERRLDHSLVLILVLKVLTLLQRYTLSTTPPMLLHDLWKYKANREQLFRELETAFWYHGHKLAGYPRGPEQLCYCEHIEPL